MIDEKKLIEDLVDTYCSDCSKCHGICRHDELFKIIDRQPKVDNWISCFDRLPVDGENVIACFCTGTVTELLYEGEGKFRGLYEYPKDVIVAWQPLPTPYNAKRGGENE